MFQAVYLGHFLLNFQAKDFIWKGKALATKCVFQNYSQMLNIYTLLDLNIDDELFGLKCSWYHSSLLILILVNFHFIFNITCILSQKMLTRKQGINAPYESIYKAWFQSILDQINLTWIMCQVSLEGTKCPPLFEIFPGPGLLFIYMQERRNTSILTSCIMARSWRYLCDHTIVTLDAKSWFSLASKIYCKAVYMHKKMIDYS